MASQHITSGGPSSRSLVPAASTLLSRAFNDDPVIRYMLSSMAPMVRAAYLPDYFKALLMAATMNKASIDEIGDWKCCGVLMPPGEKVDNPWTLFSAGLVGVAWTIGARGCARMLFEFPSVIDPAKKKGLKGQNKFYYVFFVGTDANARGQGLCSAVMREYQAKAAKEGLPVWLEATTEKSMKIYSKLGWEVVEEMILGKGKAKADGTLEKGGEGVKLWAMVWWPPATIGEF